MIRCKDPLADLLKSYGYNLVVMPKPDILPLEVLVKKGRRLERIGHIRDLFLQGDTMPLPQVGNDVQLVKELQNQKSMGLNASIAIDILTNLFKALGKPKVMKQVKEVADSGEKENKNDGFKGSTLNTVFGNVDKFVFSYRDVLENNINLIKLDAYLNDATLNEKAVAFTEHAKKNQLFIITSTLKSNSFSTEFIDNNNASMEVGIPAIKGVVGGNIGVKRDKEDTNKIVYEGEKNLIFGFKAVRLLYDKKTKLFKIKSANGVIIRGEDDYPVEALQTNEAFTDI